MYSFSIVEFTKSALMESEQPRHSVTKRFYILFGELGSPVPNPVSDWGWHWPWHLYCSAVWAWHPVVKLAAPFAESTNYSLLSEIERQVNYLQKFGDWLIIAYNHFCKNYFCSSPAKRWTYIDQERPSQLINSL